jgi:CRISPR-associated protein Cas2
MVTVKAKRILIVVAYDIENDKKRGKVAKMLEKYGTRVNYSVFECMFTTAQLEKTKESVAKHIDRKTDSVIFYRICVDCYAKTVYFPEKKNSYDTVKMI